MKDPFVFDTETESLSIDAILLGISLYGAGVEPAFVPVDYYFDNTLSIHTIRSVFSELMPGRKAIAHNAKYDLGVFHWNKITAPEVIADTLAMVHCYDPDREKNLEKRVKEDFHIEKPTFKEIIGKNWDRIDWKSEAPTLYLKLAEYAAADAYYTYKLYKKYKPLLEQDDLLKIHDGIELPMAYLLHDMHKRGVRINVGALEEMGSRIGEASERITQNIYKEAGAVFNINSGPQKAKILYEKLGLPIYKHTGKGAPSTDADVLEKLAAKGYTIAEDLVKYSELQKLNSGYIQSIPRFVDHDGMLRCNLNSCGTRTGRFSSDHPNLQNQPNNDEFPIREAFIARPGYKLLCADYSQIELRVMAHVSQDERFTEAFWNGEDIHGRVAKDLGIERKHAKIVNFGVLYGMGPESLANFLKLTVKEASEMIRDYENTYRGYAVWKAKTERKAARDGYVKTIHGRIRRLPGVTSSNKGAYYGALRQACNTVIQGSSADIIKLAMLRIFKEAQEVGLLIQVHDELLAEARESAAVDAYYQMVNIMENTVKLRVPLIAEGKILDNWSQMKNDNFISLENQLKQQQNSIPIWAIL